MSQPRIAQVQTRFAARAPQGRGVGLAEAVAAADAAVGEMRGEALREIDRLLRIAHATAAEISAAPERVEALQAAADSLGGLCGVFGPAELGEAALSLRRLLDGAAPGAPSARAVAVHLDAMQMFWTATPDERATAGPEVLEALRGLAAFPGRRAAPPPGGS